METRKNEHIDALMLDNKSKEKKEYNLKSSYVNIEKQYSDVRLENIMIKQELFTNKSEMEHLKNYILEAENTVKIFYDKVIKFLNHRFEFSFYRRIQSSKTIGT